MLIVDNENDLQRLVYSFYSSCQNYNKKMSTKKIKSLILTKISIRYTLVMSGQIFEQAMSFDYLGNNITSDSIVNSRVQYQTRKAAKLAGNMNGVIWDNKHGRN